LYQPKVIYNATAILQQKDGSCLSEFVSVEQGIINQSHTSATRVRPSTYELTEEDLANFEANIPPCRKDRLRS